MKGYMRKPGLLAIIGFVILSICEGCGANWQLLNKYDYGDGWSAAQYYNTESIVKTDKGNTRVWIRQDGDKLVKDPIEDLPSYRKLIEMNCSSGEVQYLRIITHLKDGDYQEENEKELAYMVPNSSKEALHKVLCE